MAHTQDDGFHEIQLNGKQLVFLFMAATVVSVVIFLCGVLVGRGVVAERTASAAESDVASTEPMGTPEPAAPAGAAAAASTEADPRTAAPPEAVDDLSYFDRLDKSGSAKEDLKTDAAAPAPAKSVAAAKTTPPPAASKTTAATKPIPAAKTAAAAPASSRTASAPAPAPAATSGTAASPDFTVQVAALNARDEADNIAKRLTAKGYAAYVVAPGNGAVMYRVRVGHYKSRKEAEPVSAKLQKEEQFKPWITR